jgi:hypothetical protein
MVRNVWVFPARLALADGGSRREGEGKIILVAHLDIGPRLTPFKKQHRNTSWSNQPRHGPLVCSGFKASFSSLHLFFLTARPLHSPSYPSPYTSNCGYSDTTTTRHRNIAQSSCQLDRGRTRAKAIHSCHKVASFVATVSYGPPQPLASGSSAGAFNTASSPCNLSSRQEPVTGLPGFARLLTGGKTQVTKVVADER